jgi:hypothetical protein
VSIGLRLLAIRQGADTAPIFTSGITGGNIDIRLTAFGEHLEINAAQ